MYEDMYYMDGEDLVLNRGGVEQWRVVVGRVRGVFGVGDVGSLYDKNNNKSHNSNSNNNNNNNSAIVLVIIGEMNLW
jgi:hypothetical protein